MASISIAVPQPDAAQAAAMLADMQSAEASRDAIAEQVRRQRAQAHAQIDAELAGTDAPRPQAAPMPAEDVETVEVTFENPRAGDAGEPAEHVVLYGPPRHISLTVRINMLCGTADISQRDWRMWVTALSIRQINGERINVTDDIERTRVLNKLGDFALDYLTAQHARWFPPVRTGQLPVVKKNLRGG